MPLRNPCWCHKTHSAACILNHPAPNHDVYINAAQELMQISWGDLSGACEGVQEEQQEAVEGSLLESIMGGLRAAFFGSSPPPSPELVEARLNPLFFSQLEADIRHEA